MWIQHIKDYWTNHLAATGGVLAWFSFGEYLQSVAVGVSIYLITNVIRSVVQIILDYRHRR